MGGGYSFSSVSINFLFLDSVSMFGKIGVNLFVIITAYYCCKSRFSTERLVKTEMLILFVSVALSLVSIICSSAYNISLEKKQIFKCFFPVVFGNYWYATAYIIMLLFMPFINKFLRTLSKNDYKIMIIMIIAIYSIIPMITGSLGNAFGINNYFNFLIIYIIGAYLRIYMPRWNKRKVSLCLIVCGIIQIVFPIMADLLIDLNSKLSYWIHSIKYANSPTGLVITVAIFWLAVNAKPNYNKWINDIAMIMFPAYLVHEHIIFRPILWQKILRVSSLQESMIFPLSIIWTVIIIFLIACVVYMAFHLFYKCIGYKISKLISCNKLFLNLEKIYYEAILD